ncbi:unnamed protein product [Schistocephalus solidus]|uniref:Pecanex-like protein n=1 Tax=Schistocephalus solidus TaxID=70667 RepID=A0A183SVC3_SCHSO|nr:unnamed protein product [Schistocephalus solidus]
MSIFSFKESKINLQERLTSGFQKPANFPTSCTYRQHSVQFHQPDSRLTQSLEVPLAAAPQAQTTPGNEQSVGSPHLQNAVRQQVGICPAIIGRISPDVTMPSLEEPSGLPHYGSVSIRDRKTSLKEKHQNLISDAFIGRIRERIYERRQNQGSDQCSDVAMTTLLPLTQPIHANSRASDLIQDPLISAPHGDKGLPYHRRFSFVGNNSQTGKPLEPPHRRLSADTENCWDGEPQEEVEEKIVLLTTLAQIALRTSPPPPPAPTLPRALLPVKPQSERLISTTSERLSDGKSGVGDSTTDRCGHPATQDGQPAIYHKFPSVKWNYLAADADSPDRLGKPYRPRERRGESKEEEAKTEEEMKVAGEGHNDLLPGLMK